LTDFNDILVGMYLTKFATNCMVYSFRYSDITYAQIIMIFWNGKVFLKQLRHPMHCKEERCKTSGQNIQIIQ